MIPLILTDKEAQYLAFLLTNTESYLEERVKISQEAKILEEHSVVGGIAHKLERTLLAQ